MLWSRDNRIKLSSSSPTTVLARLGHHTPVNLSGQPPVGHLAWFTNNILANTRCFKSLEFDSSKSKFNTWKEKPQKITSSYTIKISVPEYFCQLSPPIIMEHEAAWLDSQLWQVLETATGLAVPRLENENMVVQCLFWLPETRSAIELSYTVAVSCYSL